MANSAFVSNTKNKIMSELQSNELFLNVLDTTEEEREDLVYNRIFPFLYIPKTIETVTSYVCVDCSINTTYTNSRYAFATIIIDVIVHQDHMQLDMAGVSETRADYLCEIIDKMLNGRDDFGVGELVLLKNTPDSVASTGLRYRRLIFETKDLNNGLCDR